MLFRIRVVLASITVLAIAINSLAAAGRHPETGELLSDDQTFRYRLLDAPSSLDPQLVQDVDGSGIVRDLFEGLMNQDADGNLVPGVATHFTANDDKTSYTFYLRDDAKWSDGKPVTAHDFVYAWRRLADPAMESPYQWFIELMSLSGSREVTAGKAPVESLGVVAIDDTTLQVTLSSSLPYFSLMTTHVSTFPTPQWAVKAHGNSWTTPQNIVSNGAYRLQARRTGKRLTRVRNPMYWNDSNTIIDMVISYVINDEDEAFQFFTSGHLDRTAVPARRYPELLAKYPKQVFSFPRLCSYYYVYNLSEKGPPAFKDVRVRKALSYAIDRNYVTSEVLRGGQFAAYTFTPGATANFSVPKVGYAVMTQNEREAKARQLLTEAGYGADNPLSFTVLFNTSEGHKRIAKAVTRMWNEKLGVNAGIANLDWNEFLHQRGGQDFEMARAGWCGDYNEASTFLDLVRSGSGYNDGKYVNGRVDDLMSASKTMETPYANYVEVEQILVDEMPLIPLYHYSGLMMLNSAIKNWPINNVEQNWYSRNLYRIEE